MPRQVPIYWPGKTSSKAEAAHSLPCRYKAVSFRSGRMAYATVPRPVAKGRARGCSAGRLQRHPVTAGPLMLHSSHSDFAADRPIVHQSRCSCRPHRTDQSSRISRGPVASTARLSACSQRIDRSATLRCKRGSEQGEYDRRSPGGGVPEKIYRCQACVK